MKREWCSILKLSLGNPKPSKPPREHIETLFQESYVLSWNWEDGKGLQATLFCLNLEAFKWHNLDPKGLYLHSPGQPPRQARHVLMLTHSLFHPLLPLLCSTHSLSLWPSPISAELQPISESQHKTSFCFSIPTRKPVNTCFLSLPCFLTVSQHTYTPPPSGFWAYIVSLSSWSLLQWQTEGTKCLVTLVNTRAVTMQSSEASLKLLPELWKYLGTSLESRVGAGAAHDHKLGLPLNS